MSFIQNLFELDFFVVVLLAVFDEVGFFYIWSCPHHLFFFVRSLVEMFAELLFITYRVFLRSLFRRHVLFLIVVSIFSVLAFAPSHSLSKVFGSIVEVLDV